MTNLQLNALRGSQTPRVNLVPTYFTSAGDDAVDLASVAGLELDPWQEHVLRGSLGESKDGRWQAFEVGLIVSRQNGKGAVLEARELAGLFLFGEKMIIHTAHLFSTAKEHQMRLESLIRKSELVEYIKGYDGDPEGPITGIRTGNQDMSFIHRNGNRLKFLARSGGNSGRGFTGDLVVLDEAYNLPDAVLAAMMPTMAAKSMTGSPQIWYTSSAGMPDSEVLRRVRERGLNPDEDDTRLAYFEWSAAEDDDPADPVSWAKANPALGIRISPEFIDNERRTMDPETFGRERLGIWAKIGGSSAIPPQMWADCLDEDSEPAAEVAFGVDVSPLRDVATISAASVLEDGRVHVEIIDRRAGTAWVADRVEELQKRWNPTAIVFDAASQAAPVLAEKPRLRRHLTGLDARTYAQSCGGFFDAITQANIAHTGQEELDEAVEACRRSKGGQDLWRWSKHDSTKDISPLVAATLAHYGATNAERTKSSRKWVVYR
ncbi:terminase large subunit [Rothia nasimurium]|uniref:terminase large subunit n=1 Tax=Rothia nasimurium TaxID=85336 RepID=UPI001F27B1CE|nr:terminase large subunit [Rothia nasimurium]